MLEQLRMPPRLADGVETIGLEGIVRRRLRRLLAAIDHLGAKPDDTELHALRIALKRVRYAAELAAPDGKALRRFLSAARALQDLLGEHQDAVVAEELLRAATVSDQPTEAAFVAGRLAERQLGRQREARRRLPAVWKRLRKAAARL